MDVRWLDEAEQQAWRALLMGSALLDERLEEDLKSACDLTLADYEVLAHLSEHEDTLRMSELAELLVHSRSRLTYRISRLEERGLVVREACEEDRRGTWAVLTPEGRARLEAAAPVHVASVRRHLIDRLPREDFLALGRAMARLIPSP